MTKKHYIAVADAIKHHNNAANDYSDIQPFTYQHLGTLARVFKSDNPKFNETRWLDYIAGNCGPSGGKIKRTTINLSRAGDTLVPATPKDASKVFKVKASTGSNSDSPDIPVEALDEFRRKANYFGYDVALPVERGL